jgi:acyl-CoA synthetase
VLCSEVNKVDKITLGAFDSEKQTVKYLVTAVSTRGKVFVLDLDFGEVKCSYQLPGEVFSSPVVNGNYIYVGCRDNHIYSLAMMLA